MALYASFWTPADRVGKVMRRLGGPLMWAGLALWLVLAVVFAFTDQLISSSLHDAGSWWAKVLEDYGQLPGALVGLLGGSVLLRTFQPRAGWRDTLSLVGLALATAFAAMSFMADAVGARFGADRNAVVVGGGTLALVIGLQFLFRLVPEDRLEALRPVARVALALMLVAGFATVWAIKIPWGRWTYRDILEAGDASLFTPWYLPQGSNGHFSFISGHTATAFTVMPIAYVFARSRRLFTVAMAIAIAWGILSAISRVVIGAHFASDTLFAAGLTISWFAFFSRRYGVLEGSSTPTPRESATGG